MKRPDDERRCDRCGCASVYYRKWDKKLVCKTCGNTWPSPFQSKEIDEMRLQADHYPKGPEEISLF